MIKTESDLIDLLITTFIIIIIMYFIVSKKKKKKKKKKLSAKSLKSDLLEMIECYELFSGIGGMV